jgi:hypothetical protein
LFFPPSVAVRFSRARAGEEHYEFSKLVYSIEKVAMSQTTWLFSLRLSGRAHHECMRDRLSFFSSMNL